MNGPSAQALREGGVGGSLRYRNGTTLIVRITNGAVPPAEWKKKTTLQSLFGDFGQILRIDVEEQGVAYIEYDDAQDAEEAEREMSGKKICGHTATVQRLTASTGCGRASGSGDIQARIAVMARESRLDEAAAARLVSVFTERVRLGCDLERDVAELSQHLASSNKPSALVSMKLAELRTGQPIGPCKYNSRSSRNRLPSSGPDSGLGGRRATEDRSGSRDGKPAHVDRRNRDRREAPDRSQGSPARGSSRHRRRRSDDDKEPRERRRSRDRDRGRSRSRRRDRPPQERNKRSPS
mmetsp:Transcript_32101/g.90320  ORF Transcript_32101/g.90320 Transcript_32101/m.90320 type:complete len:295 (-) Transcript_32101:110-994(-)